MRYLIIILLFVLSLAAQENNTTSTDYCNKLMAYSKEYLQHIDSKENKEKLKVLYTQASNKITSVTSDIACSLNKFNVKAALTVTYTVKVTTKDNKVGYGTAVAISSNGKLVTAYHNIDSYKKITVLLQDHKQYSVKVGKISIKNDLAYLYINVKKIPYVKMVKHTQLGEDVYILGYENLLLKGIISKNNKDSIIINVEAEKGMSGGGVFNTKNELVAILLDKDYLDKTSYAVKTNQFPTIAKKFVYKKRLLSLGKSNNYDNSYCYDKNELSIWAKYAKSSNPNTQELHALFLGLCQKVGNRDLTTEEAQYIFNRARKRLIGE
jgi:hypothetical protein